MTLIQLTNEGGEFTYWEVETTLGTIDALKEAWRGYRELTYEDHEFPPTWTKPTIIQPVKVQPLPKYLSWKSEVQWSEGTVWCSTSALRFATCEEAEDYIRDWPPSQMMAYLRTRVVESASPVTHTYKGRKLDRIK